MVKLDIRPKASLDSAGPSEVFDPDTLGRWSAMPDCYRRYWSFERQVAALHRSAPDAQVLYDRIMAYLNEELVPDEMNLACQQLRFDVALKTGSSQGIEAAARAYFIAYIKTAQQPVDLILMELGTIGNKLREHWSQEQISDFILPLLRPLIDPKVFADPGFVENAILFRAKIQVPWFGLLVLDCLQETGCHDPNRIARWREDLSAVASRTAKIPDPDPKELTVSMARYLQSLQALPPKGPLTLDELGRLIEQAVKEATLEDGNDTTPEASAKVCQSIRLLVGDGPFLADGERLQSAISAFNQRYQTPRVTAEQNVVTLATFVALSFYDTSVPQDHNLLTSQITDQYTQLLAEVGKILSKYQLSEKIGPDDLARIFSPGLERLKEVVEDPLWPMFKFPLSSGERTRLASQLKRELRKLDSAAEMLGKQADPSQALPRLRMEITSLVQRVLVGIIELRSPRGEVGMSWNTRSLPLVIIKRDGFKDTGEAAAILEKMKYFYLGHRTTMSGPGSSEIKA